MTNYDNLPDYPVEIGERARASRIAKQNMREANQRQRGELPQLIQRVRRTFSGDSDQRVAPSTEQWGLFIGKDLPNLWMSNWFEERKTPEELSDIDRAMVDQINNLVENTPPEHLPVVVVNIGGMWDRSLIAIAKHLNDERGWIDDGTVQLVSTNLAFTIPDGLASIKNSYQYKSETVKLDDNPWDMKKKLTPDELEFIKHNHHLIHSIQADAAELRNVKLPRYDHEQQQWVETRLDGRIDLLIEANALMHSIKGETDLYLLAKAMRKEQGVMFIKTDYYEAKEGLGDKAQFYSDKIREGHQHIEAMGLTQVTNPQMRVDYPPEYYIYAYDPSLVINPSNYQ